MSLFILSSIRSDFTMRKLSLNDRSRLSIMREMLSDSVILTPVTSKKLAINRSPSAVRSVFSATSSI